MCKVNTPVNNVRIKGHARASCIIWDKYLLNDAEKAIKCELFSYKISSIYLKVQTTDRSVADYNNYPLEYQPIQT